MDFIGDLRVCALGDKMSSWYLLSSEDKSASWVYNVTTGSLSRVPKSHREKSFESILHDIASRSPIEAGQPVYTPEAHDHRQRPIRLMLFVAGACNLRCVYCHCESESSKSNMSRELALHALEKYFQYHAGYGDLPLEITFMGGGEPMICLDVIRMIVSEVEKRSAKGSYTIVTNGTLGSDKDWAWLLEKQFKITISSDGPAEIQDRQRPSAAGNSSQSVSSRLCWLNVHDAKIHIRSTMLSPNDVGKCCDFFLEHKCVETHANEPVSFAGRAQNAGISRRRKEFYHNFFLQYSNYLYEDPSRFRSAWFKPFKRMSGFCGAVYGNNIVTTDGSIVLCTEVDRSSSDIVQSQFVVSSIYDTDPFVSQKAMSFRAGHNIDTMKPCATCPIRYKCGGGCYIKRYREYFGDLDGYYDDICVSTQRLNLSYLVGLYEEHVNGRQLQH